MTDLNHFKRIRQRSMIWLACQDTLRERIEGSDRLASWRSGLWQAQM